MEQKNNNIVPSYLLSEAIYFTFYFPYKMLP